MPSMAAAATGLSAACWRISQVSSENPEMLTLSNGRVISDAQGSLRRALVAIAFNQDNDSCIVVVRSDDAVGVV